MFSLKFLTKSTLSYNRFAGTYRKENPWWGYACDPFCGAFNRKLLKWTIFGVHAACTKVFSDAQLSLLIFRSL
jgi:hypothetical protein